MVQLSAPAPSGLVQPPPRSHPHSVPEGGGLRTTVPARRVPVVRPSAAFRGVGTRPTRGRERSGTRAGALTCHRRPPSPSGGVLLLPIATLRLIPLPVFPGGGSGNSNAFAEPGPTARAARPPRPLPPAPAYRPLPPFGRKYRLLPPQTGTDVREGERDSGSARTQAQGRGCGGFRAGRLRTLGKFEAVWLRDVPRACARRKGELEFAHAQ